MLLAQRWQHNAFRLLLPSVADGTTKYLDCQINVGGALFSSHFAALGSSVASIDLLCTATNLISSLPDKKYGVTDSRHRS